MIDRYSRKEIKKIWEEENKYKIWLDIEIAAAQAMEKLKIIPKGVSKKYGGKQRLMLQEYIKLKAKFITISSLF